MIALKAKETDGYGWQFKKIKENQYWLVSKKESTVQKVLSIYFDEGLNDYHFTSATFDQNDIRQVWNLKL